MSVRTARLWFWAGCLIVLCPAAAFTQSQTTGSIAGTIKDANGARIIGAEVSVTSLATDEKRRVISDGEGNYTVQFLSSGAYRLSVTANGFKRVEIESVRVVITETYRRDVNLEIGTVTQETVIRGRGSIIETGGPQLGRVVDSRAVSE